MPMNVMKRTDEDWPEGNGELILAVDDEPAVLEVMEEALKCFGYRVVLARDGAEAIEQYKAHRTEIAAVLTDMMMPVKDGRQMILELREFDAKLPIIAASGLATPADVADLGVQDFLAKPFRATQLLKILKRLLT